MRRQFCWITLTTSPHLSRAIPTCAQEIERLGVGIDPKLDDDWPTGPSCRYEARWRLPAFDHRAPELIKSAEWVRVVAVDSLKALFLHQPVGEGGLAYARDAPRQKWRRSMNLAVGFGFALCSVAGLASHY